MSFSTSGEGYIYSWGEGYDILLGLLYFFLSLWFTSLFLINFIKNPVYIYVFHQPSICWILFCLCIHFHSLLCSFSSEVLNVIVTVVYKYPDKYIYGTWRCSDHHNKQIPAVLLSLFSLHRDDLEIPLPTEWFIIYNNIELFIIIWILVCKLTENTIQSACA